jgi:adenylate cyclase
VPELTAIGPELHQRWQKPLSEGEVVRLGRAPRTGWKVPWDLTISREHADLIWQNEQLSVRCLETARNPIDFNGREAHEFVLRAGESFQIGKTKFLVTDVEGAAEKRLLDEQSFGPDELRRIAFSNASQQMEAISRLPRLIGESRADEEFAVKLVALLLEALLQVDMAAVLRYDDVSHVDSGKPSMMRWSSRTNTTERFSPSRRLIKAALTEERSRLHIWSKGVDNQPFTLSEDLDWAICTPISGEACRGWCLYVSGRSSFELSPEDLKGHLRFTELMSQFIGAIRQVRQLERMQAGMSQFFSPTVLETLNADQAATLLIPKESEITVIFCDVRGFSRMAEESNDNLLSLLGRVSRALGIMTQGIVKYDGIIADFQGDGALGFWGWPVALEDGPLLACQAALSINTAFQRAAAEPGHPLANFRIGIGIAHGLAIAGKIGSDEQAKVGVFGQVVNLGARLEGMTKQLQVPILIDEATAAYVRNELPPTQARCRRLGRIRPVGVETPLMVAELLPPVSLCPTLTDQNLAEFEAAVQTVANGDWPLALDLLKRLPKTDGAAAFLIEFLTRHKCRPPAKWDGVIQLTSK